MSKRISLPGLAILALIAGALILAPSAVRAQAGDAAKEAVLKAALDYSDGAYSSDAARMERAIHSDLNKLIFRRLPSKALMAGYSTFSGLVEPLRAGGFPALDPEKRKTDVSVLEITDDIACVRLRTANWCDYLQLVKDDGQWKIINVLWTSGLDAPPAQKLVPGFEAGKESPAALAAALDFIEGRLTGDAARLEKALHPETSVVTYMVASKTNRAFLNRSRQSGILEPTKAKLGLPPESARQAEVRVLDLMDGMAFAVGKAGIGTFYLQLQLLDGQWKAINVLLRPTNNAFPPPRPAGK